jgi:hypothetical protein
MSDETCCGACGYPIHATKESACDWCRQTANRIEALTAKVKLMDDLDVINGEKIEALTAKLAEAEAYAEELAGDQVDLCHQLIAAKDRRWRR